MFATLNLLAMLTLMQVPGVASSRCPCGEGDHTAQHLFVECTRLNTQKDELRNQLLRKHRLSHTDMKLLLKIHSTVAMSWAIRNFSIPQFKWTAANMSQALGLNAEEEGPYQDGV